MQNLKRQFLAGSPTRIAASPLSRTAVITSIVLLAAALAATAVSAQPQWATVKAIETAPVDKIPLATKSARAAVSEASSSLVACQSIAVRSTTGILFADGFESHDVLAWGAEGFSARSILDLDFEVEFDDRLSGEHLLNLRLTTPTGQHYQTLNAPIAVPSGDAPMPSMRQVEGYPFPMVVLAVSAAESGGVVSLSLPVAGTQIVTHGLYGEWKVTPFLGAAQTPCGPDASFVLRP